ncbi:prephenate dehydrogenase/arogenate dehydrogenase family protein [[Eubacterium] cellulosolvens]
MHLSENTRILSASTLTVLGGTGGMGKSLIRLFRPSGAKIRVCSRDLKRAEDVSKKLGTSYCTLEEAFSSDVLIVSIPITEVVNTILTAIERMKPKSLLIDVSSVKTGITDRILEFLPHQIEYLSIHPLFGPTIETFRGENILLIPARSGPRSRLVIRFLEETGLTITKVDVDDHDKFMAIIQVLHHFGLLCLGTSLIESLNSKMDERFYTSLFRKTLNHLESAIGNLPTIIEIQRFNPYAQWARLQFLEYSNFLKDFNQESLEKIEKSFKKLHNCMSK